MRILFLDFDGVVLPIPSSGQFEPNLKPSTEAINNLNLAVQLTKAEVVVTSAWRNGRTVDELQTLLNGWGFKWLVADKTEDSAGDEDRGQLIKDWLNGKDWLGQAKRAEKFGLYQEVGNTFVVVDDDRTGLEEFAAVLVSPSPDKGLQFHDVGEIVRILVA